MIYRDQFPLSMTKNFKNRIWNLQEKYTPYIFLLPFILVFCTFMAYPLAKSIYMSFTCTNGPKSIVWIGLDNFIFLFKDKNFWTAVRNTFVFAAFSVFLQLPCSLGLAILVNKKWLKGKNIFRFSFFAPYLCGTVFVAVLFSVLLVPRFGLVNRALHFITGYGLDLKWLGEASMVMPTLVLITLWLFTGFNMIYFIAALQSVDKGLYEAAEIDGANSFQKFLHVTLPGIKPVAVFVVIMSTIGSLQLFELPYVLLGGPGPNQAGLTIVMYLYQTGFETGNLGYASAIGWVLVVIIMSVSLFQLWLGRSKK